MVKLIALPVLSALAFTFFYGDSGANAASYYYRFNSDVTFTASSDAFNAATRLSSWISNGGLRPAPAVFYPVAHEAPLQELCEGRAVVVVLPRKATPHEISSCVKMGRAKPFEFPLGYLRGLNNDIAPLTLYADESSSSVMSALRKLIADFGDADETGDCDVAYHLMRDGSYLPLDPEASGRRRIAALKILHETANRPQ